MGPGFAHADWHGRVSPRWFDIQPQPPEDVFAGRTGELLCLEVTRENLSDALTWIAAVQQQRLTNGTSPANILIASRSRRLPWRQREWMRDQITATGAVFYQVEPDQDPRSELRTWLENISPTPREFAKQVC